MPKTRQRVALWLYSLFTRRWDSKWSSECKTYDSVIHSDDLLSSWYVDDSQSSWMLSSSVEDETRNGLRNAKRNPKWNQETVVLVLFSKFQKKRNLEPYFPDFDLDFILHFDDHFKSYLLGNGLYKSHTTYRTQSTTHKTWHTKHDTLQKVHKTRETTKSETTKTLQKVHKTRETNKHMTRNTLKKRPKRLNTQVYQYFQNIIGTQITHLSSPRISEYSQYKDF